MARKTRDEADREVERAERDAHSQFEEAHEEVEEKENSSGERARKWRRDKLARKVTHTPSHSSAESSPSTSAASVSRQEIGLRSVPTQADGPLELEHSQTALSRIQTARSQHGGTVGVGGTGATAQMTRTLSTMFRRKTTKPLPNMGAGKSYPPPLPEREEYVVEFDGVDDPLHAQNWPLRRKVLVGAILGFFTLTSAFTSSIFSAVIRSIAREYHVIPEVGILGTSLYVFGFATGPIVWAPFSELYGRRWPLLIASFGFSIFEIANATSKDLQTLLICRFFAGFMGACPLTVVAAVFADMFNNKLRGTAIAMFSIAVFSGPMLAPFIGGFIDQSYLGWRWTQYIPSFMGFTSFFLILLFLDESYPPVILVAKAAELRRRTKNWGIHARQEEIEIDVHELLEKNLSRPLRMLVTEPIVLLISLYMSLIYGILYLSLSFYPIVFQGIHGFNEGVGGLPFLGIIVGMIISGSSQLALQPAYVRKLEANKNVPVPEWRLPLVVVGGISFSVGLFWFGWTGFHRDIPWIVPTLAGIFIGFGLMSIFLQCMNYLVDAYLMFAASAIAANTFMRSLFGGGFPLFATYMIEGMGIQWAGTLLGCVSALMIPIPIIFILKGATIRKKSAYAPTWSTAIEASGEDEKGSDSSKDV